MGAHDRAAAAKARLSQITTEMAARRELRDRSAEAARAQSQEHMLKVGAVAEKVAKHMGELGRRQKDAGGWATEKTLGDKEHVIGFGPEDEEDGAVEEHSGYAAPAAATQEPGEPTRIGALQDDEPAAPPPATMQPAVAQESPDTAPTRGRRAAHRDDDDLDDDFSDTSWLKG